MGDIKDAAETVKGIVEAVPVYQDALQPAAQEVGKALQTVANTLHIVLAPVAALIWGFDQIKDFVFTRVAEKLENTPPEDLIAPKPHIAGPAIEALRFTGHEESLREMYANLLATSIDAKTAQLAHPSFVDTIKQLSPDEARLLELFSRRIPFPVITVRKENDDRSKGGVDILVNFSLLGEDAGCQYLHLTSTYLDNLSRLGIIEIQDAHYTSEGVYDELAGHPSITELCSQIDSEDGQHSKVNKKLVRVTQMGHQFIRACVLEHDEIAEGKGV